MNTPDRNRETDSFSRCCDLLPDIWSPASGVKDAVELDCYTGSATLVDGWRTAGAVLQDMGESGRKRRDLPGASGPAPTADEGLQSQQQRSRARASSDYALVVDSDWSANLGGPFSSSSSSSSSRRSRRSSSALSHHGTAMNDASPGAEIESSARHGAPDATAGEGLMDAVAHAAVDRPATSPKAGAPDASLDRNALTSPDGSRDVADAPDAPDAPDATAVVPSAAPLPAAPMDADQFPQRHAARESMTDEQLAALGGQQAFDGGMQLPLEGTLGLDDAAMLQGIHPHLQEDYPTDNRPFVDAQQVSAFARLKFPDGCYYMHTYQIILGRNTELAKRDMIRLKTAEHYRKHGHLQRAEEALHGKKQSRKRKRQAHTRSVISERGGIVSVPMEALPAEYQQHHGGSAASQSHSVSSHQNSHGDSSGHDQQPVDHAPQHVLLDSMPQVPDRVENIASSNPHDCPLVPIHPQRITETMGIRGPKGISREHAKIFFNADAGGFELEVLGSNGLHHEGDYYPKGSVVPLDHMDHVQIGLVDIIFSLPDVALTEEQRARQESSSRPMSFSFENGNGELESDEYMEESESEHASVNPRHVYQFPNGYDSDQDVVADVDDEDEDFSSPEPRPRKKQKAQPKLKLKLKKPQAAPPRPKEPSKDTKKKIARSPSPPPPKPASKPTKIKTKEAQKELPKEKGKHPAKAPAKSPSKAPAKSPANEPSKEKSVEQREPLKTPKDPSPVVLKKPAATPREHTEDGDDEGIITAEIAKRENLPANLIGYSLEKRKGPGRPPKDGLMSKRARAQLIKHSKEIEKAQAAGKDIADIPAPTSKPKAARPRKDSEVNETGEDGDIRETTERTDGSVALGEKKIAKPQRPPRTPSPEMKESDYTEEQLQRPPASYVILIHEAISSAKNGQMNLQQIYSYIERHYPYYKFRSQTNGWQSSVRHNLGQNDAFKKAEKEGKGYNWVIDPTVSIEKERRKRNPSPPPMPAQRPGYYPPPGYAPYGAAPNQYPGPHYPPHGPPSNGLPVSNAPTVEPPQPRLPPSLARNNPPAAVPASQAGAHASPYASPWAGNTAGSPATAGPPRPYPAPPSHAQPSAPAPGAQYGVLMPTSASTSYGNYGNQYATAGPSPYGSSAAPRPYSTYANSASPAQPSPYGPPAPSPHPPQLPPSQSPAPKPLHSSGRYPIHISDLVIYNMEAFRNTFIDKTPEDGRAEAQRKVDKCIMAIVRPDAAPTMSEAEKGLENHIRNFLGNLPNGKSILKSLEQPQSAQASNTETVNGARDPVAQIKQEGSMTTPTPPPAQGADVDAAAIAASDAANVKPVVEGVEQVGSASATAEKSDTSGQPLAGASSLPPQALSLASAAGSSSYTAPTAPMVAATVISDAGRPSVEPLTPVPGSPIVKGPSNGNVNGTKAP